MPQNEFGESTRRAFLGTAAIATAATAVTLAAAPASEATVTSTAPPAQGAGRAPADEIKVAQAGPSANEPTKPAETTPDWTKPTAMALPKEGYFKLEQGRYGPIFPKTPTCYGFSIIAKIVPGTENNFYEYALAQR